MGSSARARSREARGRPACRWVESLRWCFHARNLEEPSASGSGHDLPTICEARPQVGPFGRGRTPLGFNEARADSPRKCGSSPCRMGRPMALGQAVGRGGVFGRGQVRRRFGKAGESRSSLKSSCRPQAFRFSRDHGRWRTGQETGTPGTEAELAEDSVFATMATVAGTIRAHATGILRWLHSRISNGMLEAMNSTSRQLRFERAATAPPRTSSPRPTSSAASSPSTYPLETARSRISFPATVAGASRSAQRLPASKRFARRPWRPCRGQARSVLNAFRHQSGSHSVLSMVSST